MTEAAISKDNNTDKNSEHDSNKSMLQIILGQFFEHRMAVIGFSIIAFFIVVAISASWISGYMGIDPDTQNVANRYQAPFSTHSISDDNREVRIENFIDLNPEIAAALTQQLRTSNKIEVSSADEDALYDFALGKEIKEIKNSLSEIDTPEAKAFKKLVSGFQTTHIFGTDELGRDVMIRLIYATRVSIGVGMLVALAAAFIGLMVGTLAGYYGGWVDAILSRITDSLLSLPILPLMIVFAAIDLKKIAFFNLFITGSNESIYKLVFIVGLFSWMGVSRLVRGSVLSLKHREFILAAKTLGAKNSRIMLTHIAPNVIAPLLVAATLGVGNAILFESSLSFLGLGIQPPTASWGNMLFNAQELIHEAPLLAILPGILILLTTISFNFVGDGLQDAIDPKSIKR